MRYPSICDFMAESIAGQMVSNSKDMDVPASRSQLLRVEEARALSGIRSCGEIDLGFRAVAGGAVIQKGYQGGCLKFRIPHHARGEAPCAILLNTSGGLAGGDRLAQAISWGEQSIATVTTQAAEKVYRELTVGARAQAEWLPQETILFDRARLSRDTQVRLAADGSFLGIEAIVLGRTAMGEIVRAGALQDRWRIWRDGRLIFADALMLENPIDDLMQRAAIGAGARAMALLIQVSLRASELLDNIRQSLQGALGIGAASCWNGMLVTRLLARDGATLRHDMLRVLGALRGGKQMPRVWSC